MKKRFSVLIMILVALSPIIGARAISYMEDRGGEDASESVVTIRTVEEYFAGL